MSRLKKDITENPHLGLAPKASSTTPAPREGRPTGKPNEEEKITK
jgi:hypothetical protein